MTEVKFSGHYGNMATCPPAGWNRKAPPQDDEYQGWHSEDNRGREAGDEHSYRDNGHAPARHGRQGSDVSPPGSFDDRRRSDQGASYNGPECTPFEDGYGDHKSPQDRIERLNVPKPKGVSLKTHARWTLSCRPSINAKSGQTWTTCKSLIHSYDVQ